MNRNIKRTVSQEAHPTHAPPQPERSNTAMKSKDRFTPKHQPDLNATMFDTAEEAWFWFILAQEARNAGARITAGLSLISRPCEPMDILKCVERLYRNRRLTMDHILVLRHYGKRHLPPDPVRIKEMRAHDLWIEALERLEPVLVGKGIVCAPMTLPQPGIYWARSAMIHQGGLSA